MYSFTSPSLSSPSLSSPSILSPSFLSPSPQEVCEIFKRHPGCEDFNFQRTLDYECGERAPQMLSWIQCLMCEIPCECPMPWGAEVPMLRFIIDRVVGRERAMRLVPQLVSHSEHEIIAIQNTYDFDGKIERLTLFTSTEDIGFIE
jgi:hypothetical protein